MADGDDQTKPKRVKKAKASDEPPPPQTVSKWGLCERCGAPGLAWVEQYREGRALCGYCGGKIVATEEDVSEQVRHVEDDGINRWGGSSDGGEGAIVTDY